MNKLLDECFSTPWRVDCDRPDLLSTRQYRCQDRVTLQRPVQPPNQLRLPVVLSGNSVHPARSRPLLGCVQSAQHHLTLI